MPEVRLPAPVRAQYLPDWPDFPPPGAVTYWTSREFGDRVAGMIYCCPCGCGDQGSLRLAPPHPNTKNSWAWDGNKESPTLQPSVHHVGHWHGWLKAGMWTQA